MYNPDKSPWDIWNIWKHFGLSQLGRGLLLAPQGERKGCCWTLKMHSTASPTAKSNPGQMSIVSPLEGALEAGDTSCKGRDQVCRTWQSRWEFRHATEAGFSGQVGDMSRTRANFTKVFYRWLPSSGSLRGLLGHGGKSGFRERLLSINQGVV